MAISLKGYQRIVYLVYVNKDAFQFLLRRHAAVNGFIDAVNQGVELFPQILNGGHSRTT
jgi:hypothetical protein